MKTSIITTVLVAGLLALTATNVSAQGRYHHHHGGYQRGYQRGYHAARSVVRYSAPVQVYAQPRYYGQQAYCPPPPPPRYYGRRHYHRHHCY